MKTKRAFFVAGLLLIGTYPSRAQTAPTTAAADSTNLTAYAGSYSFAGGSPLQKFVVTTQQGSLYGEADSYGRNRLIRQTKADTYQSTSSYGSVITFVRDAATKAITGLTLALQGNELTATKDKP